MHSRIELTVLSFEGQAEGGQPEGNDAILLVGSHFTFGLRACYF